MALGFLEEGLLDVEVWYLTLSTAFGQPGHLYLRGPVALRTHLTMGLPLSSGASATRHVSPNGCGVNTSGVNTGTLNPLWRNYATAVHVRQ
jgi:hypothetical protein